MPLLAASASSRRCLSARLAKRLSTRSRSFSIFNSLLRLSLSINSLRSDESKSSAKSSILFEAFNVDSAIGSRAESFFLVDDDRIGPEALAGP